MGVVAGMPRVVTGPATLPATVAELRAMAKLDAAHPPDAELLALLRQALSEIETITNRRLVTQVLAFPLALWPADARVVLPVGPLRSIDEVRATTADGVVVVTDWRRDVAHGEPGVIVFQGMPALDTTAATPIEIEATVGYGADATAIDALDGDLPGAAVGCVLRQHVLRRASALYDQADDSAAEISVRRFKLHAVDRG